VDNPLLVFMGRTTMNEKQSMADRIDTVVPGVFHWTVRDQRIDFRGDAYAVDSPEGVVLIDPLLLTEAALGTLGTVSAICLTGEQHQRSAWMYRDRFGVPVHAPDGAVEFDDLVDRPFVEGQALAGGLRPVLAPACTRTHYAFLLDRPGERRILFCGDVVIREEDGPFFLMPDYYVQDPAALRRSAGRLADLAPDVLCPSHGRPLASGGEAALRQALQRAGDFRGGG
jgi:glyoxylase-like metal-dependent hydrolase (beta-lactamase superfamily II)